MIFHFLDKEHFYIKFQMGNICPCNKTSKGNSSAYADNSHISKNSSKNNSVPKPEANPLIGYRQNWMQDMGNLIGYLPLTKIIVPGTYNSAANQSSSKDKRTQNLS